MLETIKNAWRVPEIRKKLFFTIFILFIFRLGAVIPVPFVDFIALANNATQTAGNDFFNYLSILTGGGLEYGALFAMSVTPYINASIIIQLLAVAIPALERLSKQGEEGRKKLAQITRYATVILGLIQGIAYYVWLESYNFVNAKGGVKVFAAFVIIFTLTAGSALVMWLGEQIDAKGIGNGISMLLFAGIISRAPDAFASLWNTAFKLGNWIPVVIIVLLFVLIVAFIVWMTNAERRIPVQYAKRVVGRKQYGGQNTHIPIKVNMSGVLPIIFASSILMLPTMLLSFNLFKAGSTAYKALSLFAVQGAFYAIIYFFLIIGFAIPGIRPGKPTSDFITRILSRITLLGALFLSVLAILPIFVGNIGGLNISIGGTSVLIVVGVALDLVQNLESQLMMRHYKGFLD